jgi:hypothetical protein
MTSDLTALEQFRQSLYSLFPKRQDSLMDLIDANTSFGHRCRSIVELSTAPCFRRQYSSITDAISDGARHISWSEISSLLQKSVQEKTYGTLRKFVLDCTPNPRPFSKTLADRTVTHSPNPAPGNKPIVVGHQYSALAQLPCDKLSAQKHWVIPMDMKRVTSTQKGNEAGMQQLIEHLKKSQLTKELTLNIGDSLYGTEACRIAACEQENLIHLFRLNSQRNVFLQPTAEETASSVRRKKVFGKKIPLSQPDLYPPCNTQAQTTWGNAKGRTFQVAIQCWENVLLRGSKKFRSEKRPINLLKITVTDDEGETLFKRPLMLAVFGKRRHELTLIDAYESYHSRYDIEHFFRFGKQKLLMDAYQTPSVEVRPESWSKTPESQQEKAENSKTPKLSIQTQAL